MLGVASMAEPPKPRKGGIKVLSIWSTGRDPPRRAPPAPDSPASPAVEPRLSEADKARAERERLRRKRPNLVTLIQVRFRR